MNKKVSPAAGDEVYDIHGRAASFIGMSANGYIVEPIYENYDEEPSYGQPETWREVFKEPPTAKLHAEVAELANQVKEACDALQLVRKERAAEDAEYSRRTAARKHFAQLERLDDFIAGKITHFVVLNDYSDRITIQTFDEFMPVIEDRYTKKIRLLCLYGDSKGQLDWRAERYSDGSGDGWKHGNCWPATSYDDAMEKAEAWLNRRVAEWRKVADDHHEKHKSLPYAESAVALGLCVPDDLAAHADAMRKKHDKYALEQAEKEFLRSKQRYEEALAKADGSSS